MGILTILLKVEWRVKHQLFEILLCFPVCLFVCLVYLSVYFVCLFSLSVSSLCSVFLLCLLSLYALNVCSVFCSVWYVCLSFLPVCLVCSVCLLCLSNLSVSRVRSVRSVCFVFLLLYQSHSPTLVTPSPQPAKQIWICGYKEQSIWNKKQYE